jgi:hypothetical protein
MPRQRGWREATEMTEFTHYTLLADGEVFSPNADYDTECGRYIMAMKVWAKIRTRRLT